MTKQIVRRLTALICFCILPAACTDSEPKTPADENQFLTVTPADSIAMIKGSTASGISVNLLQIPADPVTLTVTVANPGVVTTDTQSVQFDENIPGEPKQIHLSCNEDSNVRGPRMTEVAYILSGTDKKFDGIVKRQNIVCLDPGSSPCIKTDDFCSGDKTMLLRCQNGIETVTRCSCENGACIGAPQPACSYSGNKCSSDGSMLLNCIAGAEIATKCPCQNDACIIPPCHYTGSKCSAEGTALLTCIDGQETVKDCRCANDACIDREVDLNFAPESNLITHEAGGTAAVAASLTAAPSGDVVIQAQTLHPDECVVSPLFMTFTPTTWNIPSNFTIIGIDDDENDGSQKCDITFTVKTDAPEYTGETVKTITVTNLDDENRGEASLIVKADNTAIDEGGFEEIQISAAAVPFSDVTVKINILDGTELKAEPDTVTLTPKNWNVPQNVKISALKDDLPDGAVNTLAYFTVTTDDPQYRKHKTAPIIYTVNDINTPTDEKFRIRIMAANITSTFVHTDNTKISQTYLGGQGTRIFQAVKPDIVLIQEFNTTLNEEESIEETQQYVKSTFGEAYAATRGKGAIPNGIISRFAITDSGSWKSNIVNDREWDWAILDIPGDKDIFAVSVHLKTDQHIDEMPVLADEIEKKLKELGKPYYLVIGGDFNTRGRDVVSDSALNRLFETAGPYPVDQDGNEGTNTRRKKPYDWILVSPDMDKYEIPMEIGFHTGPNAYKGGHIFDSRVYSATYFNGISEIAAVPPVLAEDSDAEDMQHMAVIRDFLFTVP